MADEAAKMEKAEILVANRTSLIRHEGREVMLRRGQTTVRAGHPIMDGREFCFDALPVTFEWPPPEPGAAPVESATAAPGEKRALTRKKGKKGKNEVPQAPPEDSAASDDAAPSGTGDNTPGDGENDANPDPDAG